jgi:trans-aconitate methyltransferase
MSKAEFSAYFADFDWPWFMPSVEEYTALVEASWPAHFEVWGENADRFFPDAETMVKWVDQPSLVPFLAHLPSEVKTAFRNTVVVRMIEETEQSDGRCFETFRRINALCSK